MKRILSLILLTAVLTVGCGTAAPVSRSFESMDTFMTLTLYGGEGTAESIQAEIERLDTLLDADGSGDIAHVNRDGSAEVCDDTAALTEQSLAYCADTGGALDITVRPLVEEWGFISRDYRVPERETIASLLEKVDHRAVTVSGDKERIISVPEGVKLDLGATAKGYAADRAVGLMKADGVTSGILNLGGTVAAVGKKPDGSDWRVGVTDPDSTASYFGTVACHDKFIATSGNYERYFERDGRRYCHIIDPKTGYPADNGVVSVTVISDSGVMSDALSTALFVMGREKAEEYRQAHGGFEYIILDSSGSVWLSDGVRDSFELKKDSLRVE